MPPRVRDSFSRLSARLQHHFGGDNLIWFPAAEGDNTYTVPIACRQPSDHGAVTGLSGLLSLNTGTIVLIASRDLFPFPPEETQIFLLGPSDGADTPAPTSAAKRYEITSLDAPEQSPDYQITARRHA